MRFRVAEVNRQENRIIVTGKTRCGMMKGIWKSAESPTMNKEYQVELSIGESCEVDIWENEKCVPSVYIDNDTLVFQAILEDMDDEVYYLCLDVDWLEMLDIHVITSKKKRGR